MTREAQEIVERLVHKGVMRCKYGNLTLTEAVCEEVVAPVAELVEAADALLTAIYPEDVFTGESGDEGSLLVVNLRKALTALRDAAGHSK